MLPFPHLFANTDILIYPIDIFLNQGFMKKTVLTFIIFTFLFISPILNIVSADGMSLYPDTSGWKLYDENNQYALISYKEGRQSMVLSINSKQAENDSVWIFPVPADPNLVIIDNLDILPAFYYGNEITDLANNNISQIISSSLYTQIYPFFLIGTTPMYSISKGTDLISNNFEEGSSATSSVKVLEHLDKNGLVTEIISTKSATDLKEYLVKKGVNIDDKKITSVDNYIGKSYSFVVSWMSNPVENTIVPVSSRIENPNTKYLNTWLNSIGRSGKIAWPTVLYNLDQLGDKAVYDTIVKKYPEGIMSVYNDFAKRTTVIDYLEEVYFKNVGIHTMSYGSEDIIFYGKGDNSFLLEPLYGGSPAKTSLTATTRGVKISFPTEKLFFPLTLTSIYDSKIIPAEIQVDGLVTPEVFKNIKGMVDTKYMSKNSYNYSAINLLSYSFNRLFSQNQSTPTEAYTIIKINAPSKLFTEDLWIDRSVPINITLTEKFANLGDLELYLLGIFTTALLSYSISILTSLLVFKESRSKKMIWRYGLIGLFNIFSIIGLCIALVIVPTKQIKEEDKKLFLEMKTKGYSTLAYRIVDLRKLFYIPIFSILFTIFGLILYFLTLSQR